MLVPKITPRQSGSLEEPIRGDVYPNVTCALGFARPQRILKHVQISPRRTVDGGVAGSGYILLQELRGSIGLTQAQPLGREIRSTGKEMGKVCLNQ